MTEDLEVELISDGAGLAVIGEERAVEMFLTSQGLEGRDLGIQRLGKAFGGGSAALQAGSEIAANSGRWMKLTEESWKAAQHLPKVTNSTSGHVHATLRAPNGQFAKNLQFLKSPGAMLTNPAMLAGAAGLMAQLAMQQTMDEITDYLAVIDAKVDAVLRAQKDAVLADMIGVELILEEAMTVRTEVGRVSEITWSKVQGTSMTVARTQAYALRQLDALAERLESTAKIGDLAEAAKAAEKQAQEWLAVLAHCFSLQEAIGVLELDRVLDSSPDELDRHRIALRTARAKRLTLISQSTGQLMSRLDSAASAANSKVLLHPTMSPAVVRSSNEVAGAVTEFDARLGIERERDSVETKRWKHAAVETRDSMIKAGTEGIDVAARVGGEAFDHAKGVASKLSGQLAGGLKRIRRESSKDGER
ncbi:hypothetical protein AB0269_10980 [Microbacterium sp. NPDC077644]|uniref:hypothetical protein n=1 Tax=Microbacterium sp. NPDC077644 TaxID=3155055 RepID=UPI00344CA64C